MKIKPRKPRNINVNPEDLDWSLSTRELAAKHDVSIGFIWFHRRRLAPHTKPIHIGKLIDWTTVNWQQSSTRIAKSLNVSRTLIRKMRKIHAPDTPSPEAIRQERLENRKQKNRLANADWSLTTKEICRLTGETHQTISNARKLLAPDTVVPRGKFPPNIDWSLSDAELAARHNLAITTIYKHRLARKKETKKSKQEKASTTGKC